MNRRKQAACGFVDNARKRVTHNPTGAASAEAKVKIFFEKRGLPPTRATKTPGRLICRQSDPISIPDNTPEQDGNKRPTDVLPIPDKLISYRQCEAADWQCCTLVPVFAVALLTQY